MDTPPALPGTDLAAARLEERLARLDVLADIGLGLTRRLQREVREGDLGAMDFGSVALAFSRLAKTVRQCIALQVRLEEGHAAPARKDAPASKPAASAQAGEARAESEPVERPYRERLDTPDLEAADNRPIGVIVAEICETLGVAPDWSLWQDEDWAIREAKTNAPGSPYARPAPDPRPAGVEGAPGAVLEHPPP